MMAGEASISAAVLDDARVSVLEIEERVKTIGLVTSTRLLVSPPRPDDFVEFALRTDRAPESPITVKELPARS